MKILHLRNIANTHRFVMAQRALGHEVEVWSTGHPERKLNKFPVQDNNPYTDPPRWNLWMLSRLKKLRKFDIIHLHGGIWRSQIFYKMFERSLPPIAIHYHGTELRMAVGHHYQDIARVQFISTPDQSRWVPEGIWLPQPVQLPPTPTYKTENAKPVFAHFFIRENTKRTHKVVEMFNKAFGPLRTQEEIIIQASAAVYEQMYKKGQGMRSYGGRDAELRTYHGIPPEQVLSIMQQADIVFDQMTFYKVYGAVSAEAMAYGKPTLVPIDQALYPKDCPVIIPTVERLQLLASSESVRESYGRQGRAYAERVHDMNKVAKLTIEAYEAHL